MAAFNIDALLHRRTSQNTTTAVWVRHYARIETAIKRCMEYLIFEGEVGDVIEFTLRRNFMQVGTIRMKASGGVEIVWNTTEAKRLKSEQLLNRLPKTPAKRKKHTLASSISQPLH